MGRTGEQRYERIDGFHFEPPQHMRFFEEVFNIIPDNIIPGIMDYYLVSNYGRIWHKYNSWFFQNNMDSDGYYYRIFKTKYGDHIFRIHRLVKMMYDYQPGCENMNIGFYDGNRTNLFINNLFYINKMTDAQLTPNSYNPDLIHEICKMLEPGDTTIQFIADTLKVPVTLVQSIQCGNSWTSISCNYNIESRKVPANFSTEEVVAICEFFEDNIHNYPTKIELCRAAVEYIGKDRTSNQFIKSAKKILSRETYTKISRSYKF